MSLLSCSLTVLALDSQEPTALVKCTIHTDTGVIISGTQVSLPDTPSGVASTIGSAVEEMLSTLLLMDMITTEDADVGDGDE